MGRWGVKPSATPITLPMQNAKRVLVYDRKDANRRDTFLLLGVFSVVMLPALASVMMYLTPLAPVGIRASEPTTLQAVIPAAIIALAIIALAAYLKYRHASALVLRLSGARDVRYYPEPELSRTVENLCIGAGLPQPRVCVVESSAANAFSTGMDPQHASLVVTRGLLELLDRRELEGVIAHELSNIGNYDTRLSAIVAAGVAMLRLPYAIVSGFFRNLLWSLFRLHLMVGVVALLVLGLLLYVFVVGRLNSDETMFLMGAALVVYVLLVAPLLGLFIQRGIALERAFLADADAVLLTRHPEGLATALAKMGAAPGSRMKVGRATAHLYVVDPLPEDAPWWDRILSTHPPVGERIGVLAAMGGGISPSVLREAQEAGATFRYAGVPSGVAGTVLTGPGTTLYAKPDTASTALAQLAGGAVVRVLGTEGDFLRVITADDEFGYVPSSASITEVELPTAAIPAD